MQNVQLSKLMASSGYKSQSKNIKDCCNRIMFAEDANGNKKIKYAFFCHNPLCAICQKRKSMLVNIKLKNILNNIFLNSKIDQSDYRFIFSTLTTKNVDAAHVKSEIKKFNKAITKMFNYKALDGVIGRTKTNEIKYNRETNTYNIHVHLLLMVKPKLVNSRNRINNKMMSRLWSKALKTDYQTKTKNSIIKDKNGVYAVANYVTKPINYINYVNDARLKNKLEVINAIYQGFRNQTKITFSGLFRKVNQELIENQNNSFRKTKYRKKQPVFKPASYSIYDWSYKYKNLIQYQKIKASEHEDDT